MPGTVLVTGASGLLGSNFLLAARERWKRIVALYRDHPLKLPGIDAVRIDLRSDRPVKELIRETRPEWIVHCAAYTDVDWCESHRKEAWRLNVEAVRRLASLAKDLRAGLVYISTDSIFNGKSGGYAEESPPDPLNVYAESKLAGEGAVLEELEHGLIVRTNFYGWNLQNKESLAEWILRGLEAGRRVPGFHDVFFSPILANDLSAKILDMMGKGLSGVFHVAGSETCSKFEFARRLAGVFGLDRELIRPAGVDDCVELTARRPKNTSLRTEKINAALGGVMPDVESGLRRFRALRVSATMKNVAQDGEKS